MPEAPTITRTAPVQPSKDYALLRATGLEQIRQLAGNLWTDHNLHDPGITMLEALCYAITEIGHRIDQPIADLLHSSPDGTPDWKNLFFPAEEILPNCPLTIRDYRKILIDIPGVRNAFPVKSKQSEQLFYVRMKDDPPFLPSPDGLTYDPAGVVFPPHVAEPIHLNGLYAIHLEFNPVVDPNGQYIDLNNNYIIHDLTIGTTTYTLGFSFPYWDALENFDAWALPYFSVPGPPGQPPIKVAQTLQTLLITSSIHLAPDSNYDLYLELQISFANGAVVNDFPVKIKFISAQNSVVDEGTQDENDEENFRLAHLAVNTLLQTYFNVYFTDYKYRIEQIGAVLARVQTRLHAHRNLGEDYFALKGIRSQQIAMGGNIELLPEADPNLVLLRIYYAISEFFSPSFRFYTLRQLLDDGRPLEKIFEGPFMRFDRFLKDEDLDIVQRENAVYTSDLINIIMDIEGVLAVHNFSISGYIDNRAVAINQPDAIRLISSILFQPRLDIERSLGSLQCQKEGVPQTIIGANIRRAYQNLILSHPDLPLDNALLSGLLMQTTLSPVPSVTLLPVTVSFPQGKTKPLEEYYSVQHDLPLTYGIGKVGLAPSESDLRKAQAKQLKAYLLFFDQLLANFLSQLVQLKNYFSMSAQIGQSYFSQPLYEVPELSPLLKSFTSQSGSWASYTGNPGNAYRTRLQTASESDAGFLDRRNRFLDHVMARFAEDFTQYSIALFDHLHPVSPSDRLAAGKQLIADKIDFLKYLPEISRCRARAFNYRFGEKTSSVWDSENVSGYEKRVCKKLGFQVWDRRNLYWNWLDTFSNNGTVYSFVDANGGILLQGPSSVLTTYTDPAAELLQWGLDAAHYQIFQQFGQYFLSLVDSTGTSLASSPQSYANANAAALSRTRIIRALRLHASGEGLHLLEHILLRPRYYTAGTPALSDALLSSFKFHCSALKDPYSFVTTVVLPSGYKRDFSVTGIPGAPIQGMGKLRNGAFRRFAERTIREEMPSHIFPKIFWLDTDTANLQTEFSLNNFERVFKAWLDKFCDPAAAVPDLVQTQRDLVAILQKGWQETCPP